MACPSSRKHVRSINPGAKIIATADLLSDVDDVYAAGADYVTLSRLSDARELLDAIIAADQGLLDEKRQTLAERLKGRNEVLP